MTAPNEQTPLSDDAKVELLKSVPEQALQVATRDELRRLPRIVLKDFLFSIGMKMQTRGRLLTQAELEGTWEMVTQDLHCAALGSFSRPLP